MANISKNDLRVVGCELHADQLLVAFNDGKAYLIPADFLVVNRDKHGKLAATEADWLDPRGKR
jgi:hypothetical protein